MGVSTDAILFYGICEQEEGEWDDVKENWGSVIEDFGCSNGSHCSDACEMKFVYVRTSKVVAWRGNPKRVEQQDIEGDWHENLQKYCEKYNIPFDEKKVGWWMVSWWG